MRRIWQAGWLAVLALGAWAAAPAQEAAEQRFLLREASAAGDVSEVESTFSMVMDTKAVVEGKSVPSITLSSRERQKYREEVLSADAKGPTGVRRTYTIAREAEKTPEGEKVRVLSLQGKTLVLKKVKGKSVLTLAKGKLSPEDRAEVLDDLDSDPSQFFSDKPVAVGEEWEADPKQLAATFGNLGAESKASLRARFEEIVQKDGHRCARVSIRLQVEGMPAGEKYRMTMDMGGELFHALDLNRTLSVQATGPMTLKGQDGGVDLTGEGTGEFRWTHRPLKIAGKPVVAR